MRSDFVTANPQGWRIASLHRTRSGDRWITWWAPNNAGYEEELDRAGIYDLDFLRDNQWKYQHSELLVAPDYVVRRLASRGGVPNNPKTWELLHLTALFRGPRSTWPTRWNEAGHRESLAHSLKRNTAMFPVGLTVRVDGVLGQVASPPRVHAAGLHDVVVLKVDNAGWRRCSDVARFRDPLEHHLDIVEDDVAELLRRSPVLSAVTTAHLVRLGRGWVSTYV